MKYLLLLSLLFLSGCSDVFIDDGVLRDETGTALETEEQTLVTMNHAISENRRGNVYTLSQEFVLNTAEVAYFMGCSGDKAVHFTAFDIIVDVAPVNVYFYESPTVTSNGTQINASIMNRAYDYNSSLTLYANPTVTNDGTLLFTNGILGDKNQVQSNFGESEEWILNTNTCYVFKIVNNNGNSNDMIANLIFYQE